MRDDAKEVLVNVCQALNNHQVDYIVIGGAAVNYYGLRRPSGISTYKPEIRVDLDFWYLPTNENFLKLLAALDEMNVDTTDLRKIVFDPKGTYLKIPHDSFQTDFLPVMEGLGSFYHSKQNAEKVNLEGHELLIISFEDLIANKKAIGREIDQSDIEELMKLRKGRKI